MSAVAIPIAGLWLTLASDPTQSLFFGLGSGLQISPQVTRAATVYSDGQTRKSGTPGYASKASATCSAVTPAQRALLEFDAPQGGWLGETVCFRDHRGRKFYGYWDSTTIAEHDYDEECEVSLSITRISWDESV